MSNNTTLVWGDIETGGLNGRLESGDLGMEYYPIFEIAIILTDTDLQEIATPLRVVIHQPEAMINRSAEWPINTHTESGLLDEVKESTVSLAAAETIILEYLARHGVDQYNRADKTGGIFAGNSIMFDRTFLLCQLPRLHDYLHYRQIDISALALAFRFWKPEVDGCAAKTYGHKALDDIRESIEEARVYKNIIKGETAC